MCENNILIYSRRILWWIIEVKTEAGFILLSSNETQDALQCPFHDAYLSLPLYNPTIVLYLNLERMGVWGLLGAVMS